MLAGDPAKQWEWHEAFRDQTKNMYRTSYSDMSHNRESYVKSDFPSGYGGHVPTIRHDVLHCNTQFHRKQALMRADPSRDAFPSFQSQISGLPSITAFPCGARNNPTKGVVPHNGTTTMLKPPWGVLTGRGTALNQRTVPPTMRMSFSSPNLQSMRENKGLASVGAAMLDPGTQPPGPESPSAQLKRTVVSANQEAREGRYPSEAEVLAEQMKSL